MSDNGRTRVAMAIVGSLLVALLCGCRSRVTREQSERSPLAAAQRTLDQFRGARQDEQLGLDLDLLKDAAIEDKPIKHVVLSANFRRGQSLRDMISSLREERTTYRVVNGNEFVTNVQVRRRTVDEPWHGVRFGTIDVVQRLQPLLPESEVGETPYLVELVAHDLIVLAFIRQDNERYIALHTSARFDVAENERGSFSDLWLKVFAERSTEVLADPNASELHDELRQQRQKLGLDQR